MLTEASEAGIMFVCERCGWHSTERAAAVAHVMKAHSGRAGRLAGAPGIGAGKSDERPLEGPLKGR